MVKVVFVPAQDIGETIVSPEKFLDFIGTSQLKMGTAKNSLE